MARGLHLRNRVRRGGGVQGEPSISELKLTFRGSQEVPEGADLPELRLAVATWDSSSFLFYNFDIQIDRLAESGPFILLLEGDPPRLPRAAKEVLTRCQRHGGRRNAASSTPLFEGVLAAHRAMHDLAKPLVRADWNHALDVWQWALRLEPEAGLATQLAALFHDVERLVTEADARIEHRAGDYQGFKDGHARRGAAMAREALAAAGVDPVTAARAARLIADHERPPAPDDPDAADLALLNDADALSFFSLNSVGYLDYFGIEATRRKVAWTLRRLRPEVLRHLDGVRLVPTVAAMVAGEAGEEVA
jgi:hypothetical protein